MKTKNSPNLDKILHDYNLQEEDMVVLMQELLQKLYPKPSETIEAKPISLIEVVNTQLQKIKADILKNSNIIKTEIKPFDTLFKGLSRGEITVVAARPGNCSKLFSAKLACNISVHQPVMIVACYSNSQVWSRDIMGLLTGKLARDNFYELQREALKNNDTIPDVDLSMLLDHQIYLYDPSVGTDVPHLINECFKWVKEKKVQFLIVDDLQILANQGNKLKTHDMEMIEFLSGFKKIAQEYNIALLMLSQVQRNVDNKGVDIMPQLHHLKENRYIEEIADKVIFLYRYDYYQRTEDFDGNEVTNIMEVFIAKNNSGISGKFYLYDPFSKLPFEPANL